MEQNQTSQEGQVKSKGIAGEFFLNLGAIIALGMIVGNLISLLFTVINRAYPSTTGYDFYGSYSISWPVASLIVFFPVYVLLMWLLEKLYTVEPERRRVGIRKWLAYITLFVSGLAIAGDLVTVLYYFIDGRDLTTGFIMKILSVLVVALAVFFYYIYDAMGKLNSVSRKVWTGVAFVIVFASVVWGFSVLGSPRTQQLLKYDVQKVGDLQNINSQVENYYRVNGVLPKDLKEMSENEYYVLQVDPQSQKSYEYNKTSATTYELCAEFNKASDDVNNVNGNITFPVYYDRYGTSKTWAHPAGQFCFKQTINPNMYTKPAPNY